MTALGQLIESRLRSLKMKRFDLADELHISPVSVSAWVREDRQVQYVPWIHYPALATALQVPLDTILRAAEKDTPNRVDHYRKFIRTLKPHWRR